MQIVLIVMGALLTLFGALFGVRFLKIRRECAKAVGRVTDCKKVNASGKTPEGWQPLAEYEVGKKRIRGASLIPVRARYATGYRLELYYAKAKPSNFIPAAYVGAMRIYAIALPIGLAMIVGGILMIVL